MGFTKPPRYTDNVALGSGRSGGAGSAQAMVEILSEAGEMEGCGVLSVLE